MIASNPRMASEKMLRTPEEAAVGVIEAVLAGERYIVTHPDLGDVLSARHAALMRAAESGR